MLLLVLIVLLRSFPSTRPAHPLLTSHATDQTTRSTKMLSTSSMLSYEPSNCTRHGKCSLRWSIFSCANGPCHFERSLFHRSGITPSNKTTYSLSQIQNALKGQTGAIPYLGCGNNGTVLQEVWYFHHVLGTVSTLLYDCSLEC